MGVHRKRIIKGSMNEKLSRNPGLGEQINPSICFKVILLSFAKLLGYGMSTNTGLFEVMFENSHTCLHILSIYLTGFHTVFVYQIHLQGIGWPKTYGRRHSKCYVVVLNQKLWLQSEFLNYTACAYLIKTNVICAQPIWFLA